MIWLKQNEKIIGYVPFLKKEYSTTEIRNMSLFHRRSAFPQHQKGLDWSELSKLIMLIQGIEFDYDNFSDYRYRIKTKKIVDITFEFNFECLSSYENLCMETYIYQIFNVFRNLELYKVYEITENELAENIRKLEDLIGYFISNVTWDSIDEDIISIREKAKRSSKNLSKLQEKFESMEYNIDIKKLFVIADNSIRSKMKEERSTEISLSRPILFDLPISEILK